MGKFPTVVAFRLKEWRNQVADCAILALAESPIFKFKFTNSAYVST